VALHPPVGPARGVRRLFIGIFLMIPGLQIVGAALLSIPLRANIPIAAAMTFLSNPATTPFFLLASLEVGSRLGFTPTWPASSAARAPCPARRLVRLAMDRRRAGAGVRPVHDRAWRGACRIYRVACRMALVDWPQVAPACEPKRLNPSCFKNHKLRDCRCIA
jgi:hypothetical protein